MSDYKESGFEWLGEVSIDWKVNRVGRYFNERKQKVDDISYPPLSVTMSGVTNQLSHVAKSDDGDNRKLVKKDDFVINSRSDRKGSSGIAPRDGSVSLINIVLEPKGLYPSFSQYLFKSYYFIEEYFRNGKGIHFDLWTTGWNKLKNIYIPVPPLEKQKLISRYLDKKTEQINRLVEKIQKKVELLKEQRISLINQCVTKGLDPNVEMKDSGIEWIGEIPRHWSLKKVTHITHMIGSGTTPKSDNKDYYKDGHINWLVTGDLNDDYILQTSNKVTQKALDELSSLKIYPENSLLIAMYGATIGKLGILKTETTVNQATSVLKFNDSNSVDFWFYVFLSNRNYLISLGYGGGQPNISQDVIKGLRFPSPPTLDEQSRIVNKIRLTLSNHDRIINVENTRIKLLKEYSQSLISSVVTGKLRVTKDML